MLVELEIDKVHPAHKAFLLALIRSVKVNIENLSKVQVELKISGSHIDLECIYCKYSQFALKESAKVGLLQQQALQQQQAQTTSATSPTKDGKLLSTDSVKASSQQVNS